MDHLLYSALRGWVGPGGAGEASAAALGQAVDASCIDELLVAHLPLQEALELLQVDLGQCRPGHHEHAQHAVNALQREALQVGQHGLDVRPEELGRQQPGWLSAGLPSSNSHTGSRQAASPTYQQFLLLLVGLGGHA